MRRPAAEKQCPLPTPFASGPGRSKDIRGLESDVAHLSGRVQSLLEAGWGLHLLETFPDFEARFGPIDKLCAVPRYGPRARNEVGMDAQMVVNSPPLVDGTMVRGPHLDVHNKLISALLYLRR
ncbi:MAG: hypothetical protein ACXWVQ_10995 [Methyloceanibacter sp.]